MATKASISLGLYNSQLAGDTQLRENERQFTLGIMHWNGIYDTFAAFRRGKFESATSQYLSLLFYFYFSVELIVGNMIHLYSLFT